MAMDAEVKFVNGVADSIPEKKFKFEILKNAPNQKFELEKRGFEWTNVRDWVIKTYGGQCQVTGKYYTKNLGIYFYDLENFLLDHEGKNLLGAVMNSEEARSYAVCMCEAAYYTMFAFTFYKQDWFRNLVTFRYSSVWELDHVLKANLNNVTERDYFKDHICKIGYIPKGEIEDADQDSIKDLMDQEIYEFRNQKNLFTSNEISNDLPAIYNEKGDWQKFEEWRHVVKGVRVLFTNKYNINSRNKESLSRKIKNKKV